MWPSGTNWDPSQSHRHLGPDWRFDLTTDPALVVECVAGNYWDWSVPDSLGRERPPSWLRATGEESYVSTLPVKEMVRALWAARYGAVVFALDDPELQRGDVRLSFGEHTGRFYSPSSPARAGRVESQSAKPTAAAREASNETGRYGEGSRNRDRRRDRRERNGGHTSGQRLNRPTREWDRRGVQSRAENLDAGPGRNRPPRR